MEFMKKVNEISKAVGKTASETYSTVADKSGKLVEEAKLKISIADKEGEIKKIYEEIGKSVYDEYKNGEDVGKAYTKESKKIVLDWENGYGKLAKKTYRIIKGTNYKYEDGKYETFNVAAEFTID